MNTNKQILSRANTFLDVIRKNKERISDLRLIYSGLNGSLQKSISITVGNTTISLDKRANNYASVIDDRYQLVATFIRKGCKTEIESLEKEVVELTAQINKIEYQFN